MVEIKKIIHIGDKKHIALMDTSTISFLQSLHIKGIQSDIVLKDYDLILIPKWVLTEINDAVGRIEYVQGLIEQGYPIFRIDEENYSELSNNEEGNLYQIVLASTYQIGRIKSYLRRFVEKADILDMDEYKEWINRLYNEWPVSEQVLSSGRMKKKNAGEVSITILAEVVSWYYPETEALTIYSQDRDTYEWQRKAEENLRNIFFSRIPVPVSYKSNDAILCQLYRNGQIDIHNLTECRTDIRKITYSKVKEDASVVLVTEVVDNNMFIEMVKDESIHIIF